MSFLDIAKEIKASGYNPKTDPTSDRRELPAGIYTVVLKSATFNVSEKGWESIGYSFEVKDGEQKGRTEFINHGLMYTWNGKDLTDMVTRNIKFFQKVIALSGDETYGKDYEDGNALEEALNRKAVGSYFTLEIKTGKTSAGRDYRNHDLSEPEDAVLAVEIDEEDLPF